MPEDNHLAESIAQALQDRISLLEERLTCLERENAALRSKIVSLECLEEQDVTRICQDVAQDRRRIAALEKAEPQPMQKDRAEILRALLAANGGKMLAKDARQKMHLRKDLFSQLLRACDFVELKQSHKDRRLTVIILKNELV